MLIIPFFLLCAAIYLLIVVCEVRQIHQSYEVQRPIWRTCGRCSNSLLTAAYHNRRTSAQLIEDSRNYAFLGLHTDARILRDAAQAVLVRDWIEAEMQRQEAERRHVRALVQVRGVLA